MTPGEKGGSHILFTRLIRPFVLKHHPVIDKHIQDGRTKTEDSKGNLIFLF